MSTIRFWDTCFLRLDGLCELQERMSEFNDRFGNPDPAQDSEGAGLRQDVRFNNIVIEGITECLSRIGMTCHTLVLLVQTVASQTLRAGYFFVLGAYTLDYRQFVYGFLDLASVIVQVIVLPILSLAFLCLPVSSLEKVRERIKNIIQSHGQYSFDPLERDLEVDGINLTENFYNICQDFGGIDDRHPHVDLCGRRVEMDAFSHETQRIHVVVMGNGMFKRFPSSALVFLNNVFCFVKVIAIDLPFEIIKAIFRGDISKLIIFAVIFPVLFVTGLVVLTFLPFFPREVRRGICNDIIARVPQLDWIQDRKDDFHQGPGNIGYSSITFAECMMHIHFRPVAPEAHPD